MVDADVLVRMREGGVSVRAVSTPFTKPIGTNLKGSERVTDETRQFKNLLAEERANHISSIIGMGYGLPIVQKVSPDHERSWSIEIVDSQEREPIIISQYELLNFEPFCAQCAAEQIVQVLWAMLAKTPLHGHTHLE